MTDSKVPARSKAIIVLGMHRSGTSALTGTLAKLGVELGSDLMKGNAFNKKGYWENQRAERINEEIFKKIDRSWYDYRPIQRDWLLNRQFDGISRDIHEFIAEQFSGAAVWALKDPRLCRLLPLWQKALAEDHTDIYYLICIRHPYEVAHSIASRDKIPSEYAMLLWIIHTLESVVYTENCRRLIINYRDMLQDWRETLTPVLKATGNKLIENPSVNEKINEFLSPGLRHQERKNLHVREGTLSKMANDLYALLDDNKSSLPTTAISEIRRDLDLYISDNDMLLENIRQLCATTLDHAQQNDDISLLISRLSCAIFRKTKNKLGFP